MASLTAKTEPVPIDAIEFLRFRAELDDLIEHGAVPDWHKDVMVDAARYLDVLSTNHWRIE